MLFRTIKAFALPTVFLAAAPALAGETALEFDFVTTTIDSLSHEIGEGDAGVIKAGKALGYATFGDGRTAVKKYVYVMGEGAPTVGISNYIFENGDAVTASFIVESGESGPVGKYTVIGGSGAYEGATGDGEFSLTGVWAGSFAWKGSFQLMTP